LGFGIFFSDYADHIKGVAGSEVRDRRTNSTIRTYTEEEIEGVRRACRIGREVLDIAGNAVRVGITCDELDRIVHEATIERDAYPSPLNYYLFPKSVVRKSSALAVELNLFIFFTDTDNISATTNTNTNY
jgi:hypothetical protein